MAHSRQLAAIMFTDIVGYTAMMQRDKETAMAAVRESEAVLKDHILKHDGELLQTYGDGSLSIFNNVTGAVACAKGIQETLNKDIPLRIGIHLGEITRDEEHFFGDGVNIASRIESLGVAGSVLVSENVRQQLRNNGEFQFSSLGPFNLKNVDEPMEVFALSNEGFPIPDKVIASQKNAAPGKVTLTKNTRYVIFSAIAFIGLVAMIGFLNNWFSDPIVSESNRIDKSIAVLPFVDMSNDQDQQYFSDGMTEEIINALAQIPNLKVASRTSAFQFREQDQDIKSIAKTLGVSTILEGSIRKSNNRVRITAQLINASNGFHLWSQIYERELNDIFAIQDELSRSIVDALQMQLIDSSPLVTAQTTSLEAYNLYLQGRYYYGIRSKSALKRSIEYFEEAVTIDPSYALAYHGIAASYMALGGWGYEERSNTYQKSKQAVLKSLELDNTFGRSYAVLGALQLWYEWDLESAAESFDRCFQLSPNYIQGHIWRFNMALLTGDSLTATNEINKAMTLDPVSPPANWSLARYYLCLEDFEQARLQTRKTLALQANAPPLHLVMYQIYFALGEEELSFRHFAQWRSAYGEDIQELESAYSDYGWKGTFEYMISILEQKSENTFVSPVLIALYAMHAENFDKALDHLEEAYDRKDPRIVSIGLEYHWKPMLSQPRFRDLLNKMGLSPFWSK